MTPTSQLPGEISKLVTVKHSSPSFQGLAASILYVLNYGKYTTRTQNEEKGLRTGQSFIIQEYVGTKGNPGGWSIWGLSKGPGVNKKVSASPRAASHLLSILFPITRGKQKEKEGGLRKENQDTRRKWICI